MLLFVFAFVLSLFVLIIDSFYPRLYPTSNLKTLEDNYQIFADEIPDIDPHDFRTYPCSWVDKNRQEKQDQDKLQDLVNDGNDARWFKGWYQDSEWFHFPLIYAGKPTEIAKKKCPNSIRILSCFNESQILIGGFAALFPSAKLPVHTDNTFEQNGLTFNMGLKNCDQANLYLKSRISGRFVPIPHKPGKALVYDSNTTYHYADNKSQDKVRYILFLELKNNLCL